MALGDQPQISPATLRLLIDFAATRPRQVCQPSCLGRPRHPVILPKEHFQGISASTANTLKDFLATQGGPVALCEIADPALDQDIDTPEDYRRALGTSGQ
jgi:molybdenum cofactor cytidylyltransferase